MTTLEYDRAILIANPVSRHNGVRAAHRIAAKLAGKWHIKEEILQTERAKHAEQLAYDDVLNSNRPLVISVSGDGGYHEVLNGVLRAQRESGNSPVTAVYRAGNGNDHYRALYGRRGLRSFAGSLLSGKVQPLDLLHVTLAPLEGLVEEFYCHSYFAVGAQGEAAAMLRPRAWSNLRQSAWEYTVLPVRTFVGHQPFELEIAGETELCSNLSFHNIPLMAKRLMPSRYSHWNDGTAEVLKFGSGRVDVLVNALSALRIIGGLEAEPFEHFSFSLPKGAHAQTDGEARWLEAGTEVTVRTERHAIYTPV